jgi:predicted dinucleotide-binding enzyme
MKVGILGTGFMGRVLARKLAAAGHDVKAANSRRPGSIPAEALETGAHAATAEDAVREVDVVILAMPHPGFEKIRNLVSALPEQTSWVGRREFLKVWKWHEADESRTSAVTG